MMLRGKLLDGRGKGLTSQGSNCGLKTYSENIQIRVNLANSSPNQFWPVFPYLILGSTYME